MAGPERATSKTGFGGFLIPVAMFLLGLLVQGTLYAATLRDDIHDLKRDMADVRCTVAIYTRAASLPANCTPGRYGENGQWQTQKSQ